MLSPRKYSDQQRKSRNLRTTSGRLLWTCLQRRPQGRVHGDRHPRYHGSVWYSICDLGPLSTFKIKRQIYSIGIYKSFLMILMILCFFGVLLRFYDLLGFSGSFHAAFFASAVCSVARTIDWCLHGPREVPVPAAHQEVMTRR